ncbi:MAG: hypothetical protein KGI49_02435, partial [Patescibacteria group bacterium]|nr:hypothetical protein [Patescibacteria group bacterium]
TDQQRQSLSDTYNYLNGELSLKAVDFSQTQSADISNLQTAINNVSGIKDPTQSTKLTQDITSDLNKIATTNNLDLSKQTTLQAKLDYLKNYSSAGNSVWNNSSVY